jgi:hypothetical protein
VTTRKRNLVPRGDRPPAFVDRETGAAELRISPETWDRWVAEGTLPASAPGFPEGSPRWRWEDVDKRLTGKVPETPFDMIKAAANLRHGSAKARRREVA